MPAITEDTALTIVPFFVPLLIFVCFTTVMLARSLTQHDRRLELLEGRMALRLVGATAPRISPLAFSQRLAMKIIKV